MIRPHALGRPSCRASTGEPPCVTCPVRGHNICRPLDQRRQGELYENRRTWEKGQLLYRTGDPLGPIFKIITGILSVSKRLPDGRRQILDFFFPGEICGYSEEDGLYAFEGEAVTQVEVCVFGRTRFKAFTKAHTDLTEIVRATLAWKLNSVSRHLAEIGQLSSLQRVAAFLCWLSARYEEHGMETQPLSLPMSRDVIGDYLGMRIETVSRAFSRLTRLKLIKASHTEATILDYPRLAALSGSDNLR